MQLENCSHSDMTPSSDIMWVCKLPYFEVNNTVDRQELHHPSSSSPCKD